MRASSWEGSRRPCTRRLYGQSASTPQTRCSPLPWCRKGRKFASGRPLSCILRSLSKRSQQTLRNQEVCSFREEMLWSSRWRGCACEGPVTRILCLSRRGRSCRFRPRRKLRMCLSSFRSRPGLLCLSRQRALASWLTFCLLVVHS